MPFLWGRDVKRMHGKAFSVIPISLNHGRGELNPNLWKNIHQYSQGTVLILSLVQSQQLQSFTPADVGCKISPISTPSTTKKKKKKKNMEGFQIKASLVMVVIGSWFYIFPYNHADIPENRFKKAEMFDYNVCISLTKFFVLKSK